MSEKDIAKSALLKEMRRLSGVIMEADEHRIVQDILPGLQAAANDCQEAADTLKSVLKRLEKLEELLKNSSNSLHLPAEANYLAGQLRSALRDVLGSEKPIRKGLTSLDQLT